MSTEHDRTPEYRHLHAPSGGGERSRLPLWLATAGLILGAVVLAPRAVTLHAASREPAPQPQAAPAQVETPEVQVRTLPAKRPAAKPAAKVRSAPRVAAPVSAARPSRRRVRRASEPERTATGTQERRRRLRSEERETRVVARETEETPRQTRRTGRTRSGLSAEALNARAFRLQRQGRHSEAEPLLREALRKKPNHAYAQYNLGWSLVRQGKSKEAVLYLKRTSRAQPKRWEPLDKLADAYDQMGDKARAAEARERMQELRGGRRSRRSGRTRSQDRAHAPTPPAAEPETALSPAGWQQSTDRREEAWLQEKRAGLPIARATEE